MNSLKYVFLLSLYARSMMSMDHSITSVFTESINYFCKKDNIQHDQSIMILREKRNARIELFYCLYNEKKKIPMNLLK
jgi:hypothetical protein